MADLYTTCRPSRHEGRGALIDNDKRVDVRLLTEDDRTVEGARKIFDKLFLSAKMSRIKAVYKATPLDGVAMDMRMVGSDEEWGDGECDGGADGNVKGGDWEGDD